MVAVVVVVVVLSSSTPLRYVKKCLNFGQPLRFLSFLRNFGPGQSLELFLKGQFLQTSTPQAKQTLKEKAFHHLFDASFRLG